MSQTQEDIKRSGASNIEELSRNIAGLTVQNLGPGAAERLGLGAARLAAHLLILAAFFGPIERLPVTQEELGELTGLSRKTVNRTLAGFEQRGLIRTGYRFLDLLDAEGLAHVRDTGRPER